MLQREKNKECKCKEEKGHYRRNLENGEVREVVEAEVKSSQSHRRVVVLMLMLTLILMKGRLYPLLHLMSFLHTKPSEHPFFALSMAATMVVQVRNCS